jgi:CxxC-x17-CxxC domain-containing protein
MPQKRMFNVKCTNCGKAATVPFEPTKGKPVYCQPCFRKQRRKQQEKPSVNTRFDMNNAWAIRGDNWQGRKEEHHSIF